jgi:membrane protein implicated in regulation of membrane protease activity
LWAVAFGLGLVAWIVTQWVLVDAQLWLQPVIFAVGLAIVAVAGALWRQEHRSRRR